MSIQQKGKTRKNDAAFHVIYKYFGFKYNGASSFQFNDTLEVRLQIQTNDKYSNTYSVHVHFNLMSQIFTWCDTESGYQINIKFLNRISVGSNRNSIGIGNGFRKV